MMLIKGGKKISTLVVGVVASRDNFSCENANQFLILSLLRTNLLSLFALYTNCNFQSTISETKSMSVEKIQQYHYEGNHCVSSSETNIT
jgi:hypothetical protein